MDDNAHTTIRFVVTIMSIAVFVASMSQCKWTCGADPVVHSSVKKMLTDCQDRVHKFELEKAAR